MTDVSGWAAFSAGVLSFLSPCVLPLVPGYLSFMSGLSLEELETARPHVVRKAGLSSILFVLGFTVVFTAMGASASAAGRLIERHFDLLSKLAGVVIVGFGLHLTGLLQFKSLYVERRIPLARFSAGPVGSFLMGFAFAFGWTPCIGPILGAILALAATKQTVAQGVALLAVYSLGLGLPFIATGFFVTAFTGFFRKYKPFIRWGELAAGALLIVVGALVFTNRLTYLIRYIPDFFMRFAT